MPTIIFWLAERHTQGWDIFTAFYFCFITLSSIGFGDYTPSTGVEKIEIDQNPIADALYYIYVFCWILSGFVCTSVFLDRLGNKAKYAAKVGLEPISAISENYRNSLAGNRPNQPKLSTLVGNIQLSPGKKELIRRLKSLSEESKAKEKALLENKNSDSRSDPKSRNSDSKSRKSDQKSKKDSFEDILTRISLEKRLPTNSPGLKRSSSLESTKDLEDALFLKRHFYPTAFSREISYEKWDSDTDSDVKIQTDSDIFKSVTGNDMLLC